MSRVDKLVEFVLLFVVGFFLVCGANVKRSVRCVRMFGSIVYCGEVVFFLLPQRSGLNQRTHERLLFMASAGCCSLCVCVCVYVGCKVSSMNDSTNDTVIKL